MMMIFPLPRLLAICAIGLATATTCKKEEPAKGSIDEDVTASKTGTRSDRADEPTQDKTPPKIGIAPCDEYVEKYLACINERFPETAQEAARKAILASLEQWRSTARDENKDNLAKQCTQQLETAKKALADRDCRW